MRGPPRRSSPLPATSLAPSAAWLATLAPRLNLNRKMAGTGKKGDRFPIPSGPQASAGPLAGCSVSRPGRTAGPTRRIHKDKGPGTRPPVVPRRRPLKARQTGSEDCGRQAPRGLQRLGSLRRKRRRRPRLRGTEMLRPSLHAWRIPDLDSPQPRAPGRAPGAAGGRGQGWGRRFQGCCWRRRARGGRGAAKREAVGRLLLPGRRVRPVCSGQVVARRAAWRRSGPSQIPGHGRLRIPHPPPAPSPPRSPSSLFFRPPGSSGSWAGPCASRPQS